PGRLRVIEGDALAIDEAALFPAGGVKVVANLPYNVGTALLAKWLTVEPWPPWWHSLVLMFQKEVAERIAAMPGSKAYGRLSVLAQWRATARRLFDVPRQAFTPPPKVTSSIVAIAPGPPMVAGVPVAALERLTAAAFGQRRKMLRAALRRLTDDPEALLERAGIASTARAEDVAVVDFCRLAAAYCAYCKES
ncbi:MAG: 16S rRNA (adenine(1518)-N(6)/adenine(1519)-N(6))-dimethyltransferase, partial [Alphaproteobacteria bacterium]